VTSSIPAAPLNNPITSGRMGNSNQSCMIMVPMTLPAAPQIAPMIAVRSHLGIFILPALDMLPFVA